VHLLLYKQGDGWEPRLLGLRWLAFSQLLWEVLVRLLFLQSERQQALALALEKPKRKKAKTFENEKKLSVRDLYHSQKVLLLQTLSS
jgi:hypothetical protein